MSQGFQQQKQIMVLISRQTVPAMAGLALCFLSIPSSFSSPAPSIRLKLPERAMGMATTGVAYGQTFLQSSDTNSGLNSKKTLLADLDCRKPITQAEMNNCAILFARESDQALNQTYQKLRSTLSEAQVTLLVTAQLAWIKFRDDHCALEKSFLGDGSLSITSQLACVQRMSDGREKELRSLLNVRNFQGKSLSVQIKPSTGPSISPQAATLIGPDRIGPVLLGKTLGELRKGLGSNDLLQPKQKLMVDIEAIPLVWNGNIQLYILFPEGTTITDGSVIRSLLTTNPNFKTKEGVGPGMKLAEVETIYGQPTLFYNTSNESREYVTFSRQPSQQIRFGVKRVGQGLAGNYTTPSKEFNQTQRYKSTASIDFVQVNVP